MGKIPDSEWFETPKTDCVLNLYKDKEFYSRFADIENTGELASSTALMKNGEASGTNCLRMRLISPRCGDSGLFPCHMMSEFGFDIVNFSG